MVNPVVAQAILGLTAPDLVGEFRKGQEYRRGEEIKRLTGLATRGSEGAMAELEGIAPEIALTLQQTLGARDAAGVDRFFRDAKTALGIYRGGRPEGLVPFLEGRLRALNKMGSDATQTEELLQLARTDPDAAARELQGIIDAQSQAKDISKQQFGAESMFKDEKDNIFVGTTIRDPNTGAITPTYVSVDDPSKRPEGKLSLVGGYGLTAEQKVGQVSKEEQAKLDVQARQDAISESVTQIGNISKDITLLDDLEDQVNAGASTSKLGDLLPTFKESSARYEQIARQLGLQVIAGTTFGALSESEMNLAMETAVPKFSTKEAAIKWIRDTKAAKEKLRQELYGALRQYRAGKNPDEWLLEREAQANRGAQEQATATQQPKTVNWSDL